MHVRRTLPWSNQRTSQPFLYRFCRSSTSASWRMSSVMSPSYNSPGMIEWRKRLLKEWPTWPPARSTGCSDVAITARRNFPRPSSPCRNIGMQYWSRWLWSSYTWCFPFLADRNLFQKSRNMSCHFVSSASRYPANIGCPSVFLKIIFTHDDSGKTGHGIITCWFLQRTGRSKETMSTGKVMLNLKMSLCKLRDQLVLFDQLFILVNKSLQPGDVMTSPTHII